MFTRSLATDGAGRKAFWFLFLQVLIDKTYLCVHMSRWVPTRRNGDFLSKYIFDNLQKSKNIELFSEK